MKKILTVTLSLLTYNHVVAHEFFGDILVHKTPKFLGDIMVSNDYNGNHLTLGRMVAYDEITLNAEEIRRIHRLEHLSETKMRMIGGGDDVFEYECDDLYGTCDGLDHFDMARLGAIMRCDSEAFLKPMEYEYGTVPVFTGPESFINYDTGKVSEEHHSYTIAEGVSFYCRELTFTF